MHTAKSWPTAIDFLVVVWFGSIWSEENQVELLAKLAKRALSPAQSWATVSNASNLLTTRRSAAFVYFRRTVVKPSLNLTWQCPTSGSASIECTVHIDSYFVFHIYHSVPTPERRDSTSGYLRTVLGGKFSMPCGVHKAGCTLALLHPPLQKFAIRSHHLAACTVAHLEHPMNERRRTHFGQVFSQRLCIHCERDGRDVLN